MVKLIYSKLIVFNGEKGLIAPTSKIRNQLMPWHDDKE